MVATNRQVRVVRMPQAALRPDDFALAQAPWPTPRDGELLVRTRLISIDAANRAWLQGLTYRTALAEGEVMAGLAISQVEQSCAAGFSVGDIVFGDTGWQEFAVIAADKVEKQPRVEPLSHLLSLYGTSTLTAYFGLHAVAEVQPGETVVISAAGGSVGVAAGQLAAIAGARVIGIAGGADKCEWLREEVGFAAVIDYKAGPIRNALREHAPDGIDVYFDNVGGKILDRCLFAMNIGGRIACCGAVSAYDTAKPVHGPRGVPGLLVTKRLTMRGFIVTDFADQQEAALERIRGWVAEGRLRAYEQVIDGLEAAPGALIAQLAGGNRGKLIVRVS